MENNHWKTTVDEFRGLVKAKLEMIESTMVLNSKCLNDINEYIIREKARRKMLSGIYGFIGGAVISGLLILVRFLLGR